MDKLIKEYFRLRKQFNYLPAYAWYKAGRNILKENHV